MKKTLSLFLFVLLFSGCAAGSQRVRERELESQVDQLAGRLTEADKSRQTLLAQIDKLQDQLSQLQDQRLEESQRYVQEKEAAAQEARSESQEMVEAQRRLAESLKKELGDARAKLAMTERGLVLTFLDEIFFDSGKAEIKKEGMPSLEKVAVVLKETVPDSKIAVEGHTDNEPIRYSGWQSNWELSTARALAVVHQLAEKEGVPPERFQAVGYGQYSPVGENDSVEGRRQNRRVEIVILPSTIKKIKPDAEQGF